MLLHCAGSATGHFSGRAVFSGQRPCTSAYQVSYHDPTPSQQRQPVLFEFCNFGPSWSPSATSAGNRGRSLCFSVRWILSLSCISAVELCLTHTECDLTCMSHTSQWWSDLYGRAFVYQSLKKVFPLLWTPNVRFSRHVPQDPKWQYVLVHTGRQPAEDPQPAATQAGVRQHHMLPITQSSRAISDLNGQRQIGLIFADCYVLLAASKAGESTC